MPFLLALFCYQIVGKKKNPQDLPDLMWGYSLGPDVLHAQLHAAQYLKGAGFEAHPCSRSLSKLFNWLVNQYSSNRETVENPHETK